MITGNLTEILPSELLHERDVYNYPWQLRPRIHSSRPKSHGKENRLITTKRCRNVAHALGDFIDALVSVWSLPY
jgi:hypothetical protein